MQTWRQLELIAINTIYRDELVLGSSFESFKTGIITDSLVVWECEGECDRTFLIRSQVSLLRYNIVICDQISSCVASLWVLQLTRQTVVVYEKYEME